MKCFFPLITTYQQRILCGSMGFGAALGTGWTLSKTTQFALDKCHDRSRKKVHNDDCDNENLDPVKPYVPPTPYNDLSWNIAGLLFGGAGSIVTPIIFFKDMKAYVEHVKKLDQCCLIVRSSMWQTFKTPLLAAGVGISWMIFYVSIKSLPSNVKNSRIYWNREKDNK